MLEKNLRDERFISRKKRINEREKRSVDSVAVLYNNDDFNGLL